MNVNRNSRQGRGWSVLAVVVGLAIIGLQTGCLPPCMQNALGLQGLPWLW